MQNEREFTVFETDIIKAIAKHSPFLNPVISDLKVKERKYTGVGLYLYFQQTTTKLDCEYNLLDLFGSIKLPQGLELLAHIELLEGKPDFLEIVTVPHSAWKGEFKGYIIEN